MEFTTASERSKRRKTAEMRTTYSTEELSYATQMKLRSSGKLDAANIVKEVTTSSPTRASKYKAAFQATSNVAIPMSDDAALSVVVEAKLTKNQYSLIRQSMKEHHCNLYPPYDKVSQAKVRCYPPRSDVTITETSAEVKLQALLNHTAERILLVQNDVIKSLLQETVKHMNLICKWGCDGSSGQSEYKQKFANENSSDEHVFLTSLVPLQLLFVDCKSDSKIVIWKNPRPSSPRFCRPIRLQFLHEDVQSIVNEMHHIEEQIKSLDPFNTVVDGKEISITYDMIFTMIDGKVCNAVTSTKSTLRCYLCGITSKNINNLDLVKKQKIDKSNLRFGLSTLHAWIRLFECLLHLSYKLGIKKWQARSTEEKQITQDRKKIIQKGFKQQLGLIIDRPKPGYGSTNDGNTARRFFKNTSVSASITGVEETLIKRFHVILQTMSSGHDVNVKKFEQYALETAKLFVNTYPWYPMPITVHKILIHGPQIIESALLPIGQLSEDAQEARNKDIKKYRESFSRKCSRTKTMEDVFNWLTVSSDPYISSLRKLPQKKLNSFLPEAVELLVAPITSPNVERNYSDSEDDSEDESISEIL
ncbi:uncharacterized protein LOC112456728 [Temnothorax curvispinosus]|uniref:Uncharacterized protein LOC112456728 n=1 Tax=Temnothorax curvispinosus TaxID=300111 RepID=A0A6J1Q168_9HYME|nr:uncharacterized protein LOC112456728 [Temnothorax curvispinosus]